MTDKIELKPCPFCGGKAQCVEFYGMFHVICCDCYIAGRDRPSIGGAIEAWNRRLIEDALQAENERLKKELDDLKKEDGEVYFSGKALLSEVACLRHFAIENSEKIKELQKLNKSLLRKLKGVKQRRKADIRHYETVLRYADKSAEDSALRETALIEENKRLREALKDTENGSKNRN